MVFEAKTGVKTVPVELRPRVKHCLHIVDDYYIPWFNFLLHEVNPKLICGMVGLCGGNGFMKVGKNRMGRMIVD